MDQTPRREPERWRRGVGALVAGALVLSLAVLLLAGCGGDDDGGGPTEPSATSDATEPQPGEIDYSSLSGDIRIDGSSTVGPITAAVAEEFGTVASGVRVNVAESGTGGGFELFCAGDIPISDASRPIEQDEIDACAEGGITDYVEFQVGIDALTIVVNSENDWVECLTVQQLHDLFKGGGATTWSDIDPSWPDEDIGFYYPGTDSGTFDYFVEEIIEGVDETATHRGDGTPSEDDNILATGVEGDPNGIAYFGIAYYIGAGQDLKAVQIDSGQGCIEPSADTALDGTYTPLSRPLFIYTRTSLLESNPEILGFVNFYLDNSPALVPEVGYVELPADLFQQQLDKLAPYLP